MKRHFHTFDALRFFAFFKVFLLHIPITTFPLFNIFREGGGIGVVFFFVLSGFLITYIILEEKSNTGQFNLKKFFMRRILRIWPLYYLMVGFAYCTPFLLSLFNLSSSSEGYEPNWLMSLLFLENYQIIATGSHPNVSPLTVMWSLCIEEHFYILWGILLYFISIKKLPVLIIVSILVSLIANLFFLKLGILNQEILTNLWYFAFGAIPAYLLVRYREKFESFIQQTPAAYKVLVILLTVLYVFLSPWLSFNYQVLVEPIIFGALFSSIICIIIPDQNKFKIADRHFLSRLGIYTYGLYIYHTIVINFLLQVFKRFHLSTEQPLYALLLILISLFATVLISKISYQLIERPFLQLKKHFT